MVQRIRKTDLVAIAPGVGFCPDVHVGILDSFLQGRHVLPVLPVLIPQILSVKTSYYQGRHDNTVLYELFALQLTSLGCNTIYIVSAKDLEVTW